MNQVLVGEEDLQDPAQACCCNGYGKLSVKDVLAEVGILRQKVASGLQELDAETLKQRIPHRNFAKFGNKPVSFIIDHFIEEHVAGHAGQIQRNLSKLQKEETRILIGG